MDFVGLLIFAIRKAHISVLRILSIILLPKIQQIFVHLKQTSLLVELSQIIMAGIASFCFLFHRQ